MHIIDVTDDDAAHAFAFEEPYFLAGVYDWEFGTTAKDVMPLGCSLNSSLDASLRALSCQRDRLIQGHGTALRA